MMGWLLTTNLVLPDDSVELRFLSGTGPGGQNVNKVATAVQLRFFPERAPQLPERVRRRLAEIAGQRMAGDGTIVITARRHRTQIRNRDDALARLADLIALAGERQAYRVPTRPSRGARERRLSEKARRGAVKQGRTSRSFE